MLQSFSGFFTLVQIIPYILRICQLIISQMMHLIFFHIKNKLIATQNMKFVFYTADWLYCF